MNVKIITDSSADLPKKLYKEYDIDVVPLLVYMNDIEYKDGVDLTPKQLFDFMRNGGTPHTAQVTYTTFFDKFTNMAKDGGSYIYIAFSSELSGTCQTAMLAANDVKDEYPHFDIDIIDSRCASLGQGFVVLEAAKRAKNGDLKETIIANIHTHINHMEHIFTVNDLEYLYRGGRVSKTAAFMGNMLNIKPILHVEDGKLIPILKKRGRKKAIKTIIDLVGERGVDLPNQTVGIVHGDALDTAEEIRDSLKELYGISDFIINDIGSAIGSHTGPGLISVYFLNKII